jgi:hypothetical protein
MYFNFHIQFGGGIATGWTSEVRFWTGGKLFVYPTASRPSLGPTLLLFSEYRGIFPRAVKLITFYSVHIFHIAGILISIHKLLTFPIQCIFFSELLKNKLYVFIVLFRYKLQTGFCDAEEMRLLSNYRILRQAMSELPTLHDSRNCDETHCYK